MTDTPAATRTARHVAGNFGAWGANAATSLVYVAISSRVFGPTAVGGYAAGVLAETLVHLAVGSGLIAGVQRHSDGGVDGERAYVGRALICGVIAAAVMLAGGGLWAALWSAPGAASFTRAFALVAIAHPLGQVCLGILRARGDHASAAKAVAVAGVGSSALGVIPVLVTRDPLALVVSNALVWPITIAWAAKSGVTLLPGRSLRIAGERFVQSTVLLNLVNWVSYNGMAWSVSRFISVSTLGLYSRTWLLADLPAQGMASATSQVLFPSFTRMDDDAHRSIASDALAAMTAVTTLLLGVIAALDSLLIKVLLGDRWVGAVPLLAVLGISLSAMPPQWLLSSQLQARNQFRDLAISRTAGLAVTAVFVALVATTGEAVVAAIGVGVVHAVLHAVDLVTAKRSDLLEPSRLIRSYGAAALACSPLWAIAMLQATDRWSPSGPGGLSMLAVATLAATACSLTLTLRGPSGRVLAGRGLLPSRTPRFLLPREARR